MLQKRTYCGCGFLVMVLFCGWNLSRVEAVDGSLVTTVISKDLVPYQKAYEGFAEVLGSKGPVVVLDEDEEKTQRLLADLVRQHPSLLHVIGTPAAKLAGLEKLSFPIVFSMILNPEILSGFEAPVAGCIAIPSPSDLFASLLRIQPSVKKIGTVYNPEHTHYLVEEGKKAATAHGLSLVALPASSLGDALKLMETLAAEVDALWMLPDPEVFGGKSFEYVLLLSFRHRLPLIAISEKFVSMGALMALKVDYKAIGRQSGRIALEMMQGTLRGKQNCVYAKDGTLVVNTKTAQRLGIELPGAVIEDAVVIP